MRITFFFLSLLVSIDPSKWGWKIEDSQMMPVKTDQQIAPDNLLKIIRSNCKATSKAPCSTKLRSCRKHGLSCMQSCGECHGETCENKEVQNITSSRQRVNRGNMNISHYQISQPLL